MAVNNKTPFFDSFPKINYDINKNNIIENNETVTNIFFRIGILKKIVNNMASYYTYTVEDSETPEIVAEKNYGNPNAGWIVLYANQIFDPQFDWPLGYDAFKNYIELKYGSLEKATQGVHHVEKVVTTKNLRWDTRYETRHIITTRRLTDFNPNVTFDYYVWDQDLLPYPDGPDASLMRTSADSTYKTSDDYHNNLTVDQTSMRTGGGLSVTGTQEYMEVDGDTVIITTRADVISNYDYEFELNESKRHIKVIKPMYYAQIMEEFNNITGNPNQNFIRRLS